MAKGFDQQSIEKIKPLMQLQGTTTERLALLKEVLTPSEIGMQGITELQFVIDQLRGRLD